MEPLSRLTASSLSQLLQSPCERSSMTIFIILCCTATNLSYERTLLELSWIFELNL